MKDFIQLLKLPPTILAAVAMGTGLILFLPISILERLGLDKIPEQWKTVLGLALIISSSLLVVYFNNPTTSFISTKQYQNYSNEEVETLIQRNKINTLVNLNQSKQNMNQTYQNQITRISGYTSTNHKLYNSYLDKYI